MSCLPAAPVRPGPLPGAARVAVCVCTLRRREGLHRLLEGLAGLRFSRVAQPAITVVIVDNDATPSAEPNVAAWRKHFPWQLLYRHEPRRGLVWARNAGLDAVLPGADWIAFIDDDERPEPQWLDELLGVARSCQADVVGGPVKPLFAAPVPDWAERGRFFEIGPYRDGTPTTFIATNNALIAAAAVERHGWRFHPAFNLTGGEDQHFFLRAVEHGCVAVTAGRALVWETVPADRVRMRWLLQRRFRMGTTLATIDRLRADTWPTTARRSAKALGRMALGCGQLVLVVTRGKVGLVQALGNIAWGLGSIAGLLGWRYLEYAPRSDERMASGGTLPPQPSRELPTREA